MTPRGCKLSVLRGEMDALLGGDWQGAAANGFAQGWERWQAGANEVLAALRTMGRLLGTTGQDYAALDGASSDQLRNSRGGPVTGRFRTQADARVNCLHTTWSGPAADAHRAAHDEWKHGAEEMRATVPPLRNLLLW